MRETTNADIALMGGGGIWPTATDPLARISCAVTCSPSLSLVPRGHGRGRWLRPAAGPRDGSSRIAGAAGRFRNPRHGGDADLDARGQPN